MTDKSNAPKKQGKTVSGKEKTVQILSATGKVILKILSYVVNIILTVALVGLISGVIIGTVFAIYIKNELDLEIDPSTLISVDQDTTTRVYYMKYDTPEDRLVRNGTAVELEDERLYGSKNSLWADYSSLPKDLIDAFISVEDHRFYSHNGVDWVGTSKAVVNFFVGFDELRGASTITQQLVKNLTGDDDFSIQRKVEEIFRAINLEKQLSKEEILEMYLNIVYLGNNCYGVRTAAETYFGKDVSELNLVECASLAAIVKNPSRYEPLYHDEFVVKDTDGNPYLDDEGKEIIDGNKVRRGTVLFTMYEYGCISESEYKAALEEELNITYFDKEEETEDSTNDGYTVHSWYVDSVIEQIIEDLMEKNGWSRAIASTKLYTSGYSIYIPMDPDVQNIMEEFFENEENLPKVQEGLQPESAMVITDPYTGDVLGLIGGRGEKTANLILNRATGVVRPIGSSIKPISVYAPAMDAGLILPDSLYEDAPVMINTVVHNKGTPGEWTQKVPYPHNYPDYYRDYPVSITEAVTNSLNTIAMKVLQKLSIDTSFGFMQNTLHIDSLIENRVLNNGTVITDKGLAALALGQLNYGMTVMEVAAAYSIFPNNGLYESPNLYLYVEDSSGNRVLENTHYTEVAIKESTAKNMTAVMTQVMERGTGMSVTLRNTVDVAGKTGTTNADFDRYFVGYTPYCVGAVWTGYDINSSLSAYYFNPSAKIWDEIMTKVHEKYITEAANGGKPLKEFDLEDVDDLYPTDEEIEDAKEEMDIGAWKEDLVSKPEDGEE